MIIKKVSCEQFAGLLGRSVEFKDGLNLLIDKNESGKSTIVDLIYQLFFQKAALGDKSADDKKFKDRYFPNSTDKYQEKSADGTICFEADGITYELSKNYVSGKDGSAVLKVNNRPIRDPEKIESILIEDVLKYGKGTFDELNFVSQKREQTALNNLLGNSCSNSMAEISKGIKNAVQESGNVDTDGLEKAISEKLTSMDKKWDFDRDMPKGGKQDYSITSNDEQTILKAYYDKNKLLDERDKAREDERLENQWQEAIHKIKEKQEQTKELREKFQKSKGSLDSVEKLEQVTNEYREIEDALVNWPKQTERLNQATAFNEEYKYAEIKEKYQDVKQEVDLRDKLQAEIEKVKDISNEDIENAESLSEEISKLEGELRGMKISANIRQLGPAEVQVRSSVSGELMKIEDNKIDISEATNITVPGVVEIELLPKGVDLFQVQETLKKNTQSLQNILDKYKVSFARELRDAQIEKSKLEAKLNLQNNLIDTKLGLELSWEQLCEEARQVPEATRTLDEIKRDMDDFCGGINAIRIEIGKVQTIIDGYKSKYGTVKNLVEIEKEKSQILKNLKAKMESGIEIPEEFKMIKDPIEFENLLDNQLKDLEAKLDEQKTKLWSVQKGLQKSSEELNEKYEQANAEFIRRKDEYHRWEHIQKTFLDIKEKEVNNPTGDIEKYFKENLRSMTEGSIQLEGLNEDLSSSIVSGNNRLKADILSEGTKDTISLAFRLAMLEHLYPDGGCVAIFDDPFTDMDPERTKQACKLLQQFAEKNQVIFVSCDEKYDGELLKGNRVRIV